MRSLQTTRLTLRAPVAADASRLFEIHGDPETNKFNPLGPHADIAVSQAILDEWMVRWDQDGFSQWAVAETSNPDRLIGFGGLSMRPYGDITRLNLGYRFAPEAWGKGLATELGRAALDAAFDTLGAQQVFALVRPHNAPSIAVLERLGMRRDGLLDDVPGEPSSLVFIAEPSGD